MKRLHSLLLALMFAPASVALAQVDLAPTPPMGWNSWNTFQTHIDEKLIESTADAMIANGMRDAGYVYVNLDDGWSMKQRDAQGNLVGDVDRFPHGMKALGDYLHSHGFKFGIYNCAGTETCAGYPGGKGHEEQDARTYASWGVDYLKYDWCHTERMNAPQAYRKMHDALVASGRPIVFSICEWGSSRPWTWAIGIGQLWRTTGDIGPFYHGVKTWNHGWKDILDLQAGLAPYAGPGHWNDPDMLEVGNGNLTLDESRAHFSLWCMLAAPLIAGNDVRHMSGAVRDIMTRKDVIAIDQDRLGKEATRAIDNDHEEVWVKPLSGGAFAVCILNTQPDAAALRQDWSDLHDLAGKQFSVRDVWSGHDLGTTASPTTAAIPAHGVALLMLQPLG